MSYLLTTQACTRIVLNHQGRHVDEGASGVGLLVETDPSSPNFQLVMERNLRRQPLTARLVLSPGKLEAIIVRSSQAIALCCSSCAV